MNGKFLNFAIIVAGVNEEYQSSIIEGVIEYAKEHNANVYCFAAFGEVQINPKYDKGEYNIFNLLNYDFFDGIIFLDNTISIPMIKEDITNKVKQSGIPTVVFDSKNQETGFYNIEVDNFKAMEAVVNHVIEKHDAKIINYVSGPSSNPESRQRFEAYKSALKSHGIEYDERRVFFGQFRSIDGRDAGIAFLESELEFPQAIVCANDAMALTLITTIEKKGFKIPDDVIVTGFDNIYSAKNFSPQLTTVERPLRMLGYKACEIIVNVTNGKNEDKEQIVSASPVIAESCGCNLHHEAVGISKFKRENSGVIESYNYNIAMLNRMTTSLADSETIYEHMRIINKGLDDIRCDDFYLCLCDNWMGFLKTGILNQDEIDETEAVGETLFNGYTEDMCVALERENGVIKHINNFKFKSKNMLPREVKTGGNIYYFLSTHFCERCFGYVIVPNSDFPLRNMLFHTWIMNISNAVENIRKLTQLNDAISELDKLYAVDPLCDIFNRNGFIRSAGAEFKKCVAQHRNIMIMFIDMDGLKIINDEYSHKDGDFALRTLASIFKSCCTKNEICARFGGDEFLIFSTDYDYEMATELSNKIKAKMKEVNETIKKPYELSASIGCYITEARDDFPLFNVITKADQRMYEEKKRKKTSRYLRHI